jgi:hypothetical protein
MWLHHNLSRQPGIWLPPVKEIHFFDHTGPSWLKRVTARQSHLRSARARAAGRSDAPHVRECIYRALARARASCGRLIVFHAIANSTVASALAAVQTIGWIACTTARRPSVTSASKLG